MEGEGYKEGDSEQEKMGYPVQNQQPQQQPTQSSTPSSQTDEANLEGKQKPSNLVSDKEQVCPTDNHPPAAAAKEQNPKNQEANGKPVSDTAARTGSSHEKPNSDKKAAKPPLELIPRPDLEKEKKPSSAASDGCCSSCSIL